MKNRLTKIYTRTGDDGSTGLADGRRIAKTEPRIEAIGSIDELNSALGLLRACGLPTDIDQPLEGIQHRLFDLGGELAIPGTTVIADHRVVDLEQCLDRLNEALPPLREFVLPGGNEAAARCHLARSICRRAERDLLRLSEKDAINPAALRYLNRLSDLLFVMARVLARRDGGQEIAWRKDR